MKLQIILNKEKYHKYYAISDGRSMWGIIEIFSKEPKIIPDTKVTIPLPL
jgi:hypothetical protein